MKKRSGRTIFEIEVVTVRGKLKFRTSRGFLFDALSSDDLIVVYDRDRLPRIRVMRDGRMFDDGYMTYTTFDRECGSSFFGLNKLLGEGTSPNRHARYGPNVLNATIFVAGDRIVIQNCDSKILHRALVKKYRKKPRIKKSSARRA